MDPVVNLRARAPPATSRAMFRPHQVGNEPHVCGPKMGSVLKV